MRNLERKKVWQIKKLVGKSAQEISLITGIGINRVWRYKQDRRIEKNWKDKEEQILTEMRLEGKPYTEIGKALNRSPNSVRIKMHRIRQDTLNNYEKRMVLHYLKLAFVHQSDVKLTLRALRKARIFENRSGFKNEYQNGWDSNNAGTSKPYRAEHRA